MSLTNQTVAIIGAGPSGLMAAEVLSLAGISVDVYDAMPSAGRKFLMAGKGGLNITHAESFQKFLNRYAAARDELEPMLRDFSPDKLRAWAHDLGITTFVGSSGRVFPKEMKAAPLLRAWLHRLRVAGVRLHMRHHWLGWNNYHDLLFATQNGELSTKVDAVILALGGGSWPQLGSTGTWMEVMAQHGVDTSPLKPANCGFEVAWSEYFRSRFSGQPLKPVAINFTDHQKGEFHQQGELMITEHGLEGGLIYALSAPLREAIAATGSVLINLDLTPDRDLTTVIQRLSALRGKDSLNNHLRKRLGLDAVKAALLREALSTADMSDLTNLATTIKSLPIKLLATRPLAEAISSAGGIKFSALNQHLMLHQLPGVFCAGEMLDWEAPTGGYLLTASFATGLWAGRGVLDWLNHRHRC